MQTVNNEWLRLARSVEELESTNLRILIFYYILESPESLRREEA